MDIKEFRQKYPDYNDMSDKDLAESFYAKHYSDMPKEQFMAKFLGSQQVASTVPTTLGEINKQFFKILGPQTAKPKEQEKPSVIQRAVGGALESAYNVLPGNKLGEQMTQRMIPPVKEALDKSAVVRALTDPNITDFLSLSGVDYGLTPGIGMLKKAPLVTKKQADIAEIINIAQREKVPLAIPDMVKKPALEKITTATEYLPFTGWGKFRETQMLASKEAAKGKLEKLKFGLVDDWQKTAQKSMKDKKKLVDELTRKKYKKVEELANEFGQAPVTNMQGKAKEMLEKELKKAPEYQDKQLIKTLEQYATDPQTNWGGLREIRSDLGGKISDYYSGKHSLVGQKGVEKLQALKGALEKDMADFTANKTPALYKTWKEADMFYKKFKLPYKELPDIRKALNPATPGDEIYQIFIKRKGSTERAQRFYNALDNKGREAVRYGMTEEAFNKALKKTARTEHEIFSPAVFHNEMKDIEHATGVFFKGSQLKELDGFTKLMDHVRRSGQYMENPPTGQRVILFLLGGAARYEPTAVAGVVASGRGFKWLMTSTSGKNFLLSAAKLKPGSPEMESLIGNLQKTAQTGLWGTRAAILEGE